MVNTTKKDDNKFDQIEHKNTIYPKYISDFITK